MVRKFSDVGLRIVYVFLLVAAVFIAGILFGFYLKEKRVESVKNLEEEIKTSINDLELLNELFISNPCGNKEYLNYLTRQLDKYAIKLTYLEEDLGKDSPTVLRLKKPYTLLLLKHFFAIEEIKKQCNKSIVTILFFYSNAPEFIDLSENQAIIIGYARKKYEDRIKVYALDTNLGLQVVDYLREKYNITSMPSLVINDRVYGYLEKDQLVEVIDEILGK
jgi:hypothetical protein